ncbi:MAG: PAS domain S-box protein [Rhizomicrobium sp.]
MAAPAEFWASATPAADIASTSDSFASLAENLAGVGYWKLDVATQAIKWSKGLFRIYGLPEGRQPDLESAMAAVHPEDIERAYDLLHQAIAEGRDYSSQARVRRPDGSWRLLKNQSVCLRDKAGAVVTVLGTILDVTDIQHATETPYLSDARYRLLAENATEIILELTTDGFISFVTPTCRTVLGYEPHELIGHRSLEFTHPADAKNVLRAMGELIAAGPGAAPVAVSYRALHKQGHWVWLEGQPKVIFDDVTKQPLSLQDILRDVTARREAEDRLKESEERYRLLAEQSKDVIVRVRADGTTLYVSPGCRVMGYEPEELIGTTGQSLVHPEDLESFIANGLELRSGTDVTMGRRREHRFKCKNGEWVWLQGNPTVVRDEQGVPREFLNVLRDVTERRIQDAALAEAKVAAEAATAAKSEFLANMSHEFRTPLTSIIGFSQLLKGQPELSAQSAGFVDSLAQASHALLAVVNDVLDFSKLEAGQIAIAREPGSPGAIATDAIQLFAPLAETKGIALNLELGALPDTALIDGARLRQILLNLVGNAVKFTEKGSVTVKAAFADGQLRFEICDTGPGIPDDQLGKLFKRFSQIDGTSRRTYGGTGLGLAICKGLVDAMDGSIAVQSKDGEGSRFIVRIPAAIPKTSSASPATEPDGTNFGDLRILVADDNRANRILIGAMLQPLGVQVSLATTGREAVVSAAAERFDVILMDLHMPEMDGYDAALAIRDGAGPNAGAPILAFTADSALRPERDGTTRLFDGIVRKPMMPDALIAALGKAAGIFAETPGGEVPSRARSA